MNAQGDTEGAEAWYRSSIEQLPQAFDLLDEYVVVVEAEGLLGRLLLVAVVRGMVTAVTHAPCACAFSLHDQSSLARTQVHAQALAKLPCAQYV